jgi:hypothetical protein
MRCQGRDQYLWNVACDYVINGWLMEMGVGEFPASGALFDPALKGLSVEAVYDRSWSTCGAIANWPLSGQMRSRRST